MCDHESMGVCVHQKLTDRKIKADTVGVFLEVAALMESGLQCLPKVRAAALKVGMGHPADSAQSKMGPTCWTFIIKLCLCLSSAALCSTQCKLQRHLAA